MISVKDTLTKTEQLKLHLFSPDPLLKKYDSKKSILSHTPNKCGSEEWSNSFFVLYHEKLQS